MNATVYFSNINCDVIELGSLWNFEDCLFLWLEMHFCKNICICGEKIPIEGGLHWRSHNIPLMWFFPSSHLNRFSNMSAIKNKVWHIFIFKPGLGVSLKILVLDSHYNLRVSMILVVRFIRKSLLGRSHNAFNVV